MFLYQCTACKETHMQILSIKLKYLMNPPLLPPLALPQSGDASCIERNFARRRKLFGIHDVMLLVQALHYGCGPWV